MITVTAEEMKEIDRRAREHFGIPALILMEHAGRCSAEAAFRLVKRRKNKKIIVLCGPGNNGGDGFVCARHLKNKNLPVIVYLTCSADVLRGGALVNYAILRRMNAALKEIKDETVLENLRADVSRAGLIIDAIFGIGLSREIGGRQARIIEIINTGGKPVLSLDTPSGLCAGTGRVLGVCVKAHTTVTFGFAKKGFFTVAGRKCAGRVVTADIGFPREILKGRDPGVNRGPRFAQNSV